MSNSAARRVETIVPPPHQHEPAHPRSGRMRLYETGMSSAPPKDLPAVLEGDPERVTAAMERWRTHGMSMAAHNALGAKGWVLDDLSGEFVGRVDVGWFVQRARAALSSGARRAGERTVVESGFFARRV